MQIKKKGRGGEKLQLDITNSMSMLSKNSEKFETVKAFTGIMLHFCCTASAASADSVATFEQPPKLLQHPNKTFLARLTELQKKTTLTKTKTNK